MSRARIEDLGALAGVLRGTGAILVGTFVAATLATWLVRWIARRRQIYDLPNSRSAHNRPTPRLGGLGIVLVFLSAAFLVVVLAGAPGPVQTALFGTGAISVLGLIDDLQPQPAWRRLVVQFLAAALVVGAGWENLPAAWSLFGEAVPRWLLGLLSLFWLVWITNLYNFMDGIDGLAAGQAVIGASAIAIVGFAAGAPLPALLGLLLVAASLGFLAFNFPPATIFMGDVGSTAIGFFLASLPLVTERGAIPVEVAALAIALFIFDATWTLFRRLLRRERLSVAHRSHVYQRPLSLGVGHRRITLTAWAGMLVVGGAAVIYPGFGLPGRLLLIGVAAATFALLANIVAWLERTPSRGVAGRHE